MKVRVLFAATGPLAFASQTDLGRALERCFRRAELRLAMTAGFNPRPKMSFGPALPNGYEGWAEPVDVEFVEEIAPDGTAWLDFRRATALDTLVPALNERAPAGLRFLAARELADGEFGAIVRRVAFADYLLAFGSAAEADAVVDACLARLDPWPALDEAPASGDLWLVEAGEGPFEEVAALHGPRAAGATIGHTARAPRGFGRERRVRFLHLRGVCLPDRVVRPERVLPAALGLDSESALFDAGVVAVARVRLLARGDRGLIEVF